MIPPTMDWHGMYIELQDQYQAALREVDRLEEKVTYWKAEAERLQTKLDNTSRPAGTCKRCGKPFEQQQAGRRRVYCSDSCKTQDSRDRRPFPTPPAAKLYEIFGNK